jgi:hypothetical protein
VEALLDRKEVKGQKARRSIEWSERSVVDVSLDKAHF